MSDSPDLHQLSIDIVKLRGDFEAHLQTEELKEKVLEKRLLDIDNKTTEMYNIMTEGKQSWRTILFAGSIVVAMFTFLAWAVSFIFQIKEVFGKVIK